MILLFDETYLSPDGNQKSRNIWYSSIDMVKSNEFGNLLNLNYDLIDTLTEIIINDLSDKSMQQTETNWYFYGEGITKEDVGKFILPAIMVREKAKDFIVNVSVTDYDFALFLDEIVQFRVKLEEKLKKEYV